MKTARQPWVIVVLLAVLLLDFAKTAHGQSFSLYSASNSASTNLFSTAANDNTANEAIPIIEMTNIPMSAVIAAFEKQSGISYAMDARLSNSWSITDDEGHRIHDPNVSFRWTNMTAKDALYRLLQEHHLTVEENPWTTVLMITYQRESIPPVGADLFPADTNRPPLIEFEDAPITVALENLARQARFNYLLDPEIGYGQRDEYGNIIHEPTLSFRWTNITAAAAFAAICNQYQLAVVRDPHINVTLIRYPNHGVNFVESDFYGNGTNVIPLIEFRDVPFSVALENLVKQSGMRIILSPRLQTDYSESEPTISLLWKNITARQALAAICENYDLNVIKYPISGVIRIEPND